MVHSLVCLFFTLLGGAEFFCPAGARLPLGSGERQIVGLHIPGKGAACAYNGPGPDGNGGYQRGIGADKGSGADAGMVF